ncbi:hypothetical protein DP939_11880 [Spongiactinospora rosea]|uniref:Uncharacterized protein n=1 Tax=Spongiactinospora rosea TaxID=2248750 RepID=A0A366M2J9_9ACTN|nr:helix-turn-helix domain-containing protein [Spongiactinospora rosea]RBQ20468.1 hypothetical protein DP939_11880 [Spongiactinospora rosea]
MAGRRAQIDRQELSRLVAEGWTVRRIAEHFGVSESGVLQAKRAAGLARPTLDHRAAIPWTVKREHVQSGPATNLRNLSAVAQGGSVPPEKVNTALRWAQRLIDAGSDVTYDPVAGFTEVPAAPDDSHIAGVLARARQALSGGAQDA